MKVSVSLSDDDLEFVDQYVARNKVPSRSAAIHQAIYLLRTASLEDAYTAALDEWESGEDAALWEATTRDGLAIDSPR